MRGVLISHCFVAMAVTSCLGCATSMNDFHILVGKEDDLHDFLKSHNVIGTAKLCPVCKEECSCSGGFWRCGRRVIFRGNKKVKRGVCGFKELIRKGTWFSKSKISIKRICLLMMYWLCFRIPRTALVTEDLGLNKRVFLDWSNFCRELCVKWVEGQKVMLGGPGLIDEAKIGKSKYNRGREVEGQ